MSTHPYDKLTPDRVIDAVESTGRLSDARLLALNSYENRVYQVGVEEGTPIIAKFYRPNRWTKAQILEESKKYFRPEFLNRLDELVVFHMLEKKNLEVIVDLECEKLFKRLAEREITLKLDKSARDLLIEKGYDPSYGARPMRRAVERYMEDPLAEALLKGDVKEGNDVKVSRKKDTEELTFKPIKKRKPKSGEAASTK